MKKVWSFILSAVLFFIIVFGIQWAGEVYWLKRGKELSSMLIESGGTAIVFAIFLSMIARRQRIQQERDEALRERRRAEFRKRGDFLCPAGALLRARPCIPPATPHGGCGAITFAAPPVEHFYPVRVAVPCFCCGRRSALAKSRPRSSCA